MPIGRGIDGVQLLVLTAGGALATIDEEGEIVVRTPHLARGYLDGEARGFGTNAFTGAADDRVYRTGDRGSYLADGTIQVLGRRDEQVKIRGFRVELAEVTAAVLGQPGVQQATVVFDDTRRGLIAYVVGEADAVALVPALRALLPSYMVPATVVKIAAIPLTRNGKLDRRALPRPPATSAAPDAGDDEGFTAVVAGVWRTVLGVDEVGLHDNFFDLGGHSLLATQLAVRLRDAFDVEVPVRVIFDAPTVAELAERIVSLVLESASPDDLAAMANEAR